MKRELLCKGSFEIIQTHTFLPYVDIEMITPKGLGPEYYSSISRYMNKNGYKTYRNKTNKNQFC